MKVTHLISGLGRKLRRAALAGTMLVPGVAVIAGGLSFAGQAEANLIVNGSFETASPTGWADGAGVLNDIGFNQYSHTTQVYYAGPAPAGSGAFYGWRWGRGNGTGLLGTATQKVDVSSLAGGPYVFDAWLASYTADNDYATIKIEWFDGAGATGNSLGSTLFDGNDQASSFIVGSADASGLPDSSITATQDNWTLYRVSGTTPATALSAAIVIAGNSVSSNGNDAYVDLVSLGVPEPGSLALMGLGGMALAGWWSRPKRNR